MLGLTSGQIDELNTVICGTQMIEGAPHLREEHLAVFDCANTCGKNGKRFIAAEGHIRMMAAAQPFISGAISKTINLPNKATLGEIASAYRLSWELGLKANALYRDGCKLSQPLSSTSDQEKGKEGEAEVAITKTEKIEVIKAVPAKPTRRRLPDTRRSITHKFNVAGHEGYLTVGLYEDGKPGELFITMSKEGSTIGGLMDAVGTATSVSLQYGVPVESLVTKFSHQRFEPAGFTENPDIPIAKSLVDYIFRWMGMQFIDGYREEHAPKRGKPAVASDTAARFAVKDDVEVKRSPTAPEPMATVVTSETVIEQVVVKGSVSRTALDALAKANQGDAPACSTCGSITVRSGTCYKCLNCGASMGCS
jgi:ribonucleoside-diphosphate reductase alpha chain